MTLPGLGFGFALLYFALIIYVVWTVIFSLKRISRGVEDIAESLRRMQSIGAPRP